MLDDIVRTAYDEGYSDARSEVASVMLARVIDAAKQVKHAVNKDSRHFTDVTAIYLTIVGLYNQIFGDEHGRVRVYFDTDNMPLLTSDAMWAEFLKEN